MGSSKWVPFACCMIVSWKQVALTCPDWYTCRYPSEKCPKNCWFPVGFPLNQGQKGLKRHAAGVGVVLNRSPLMAAWLSLAPASTPGRFLGVARWRNQRGMRGSRGWGMLNPSSRSCGGTRRIQGCDEKRSRNGVQFFAPLLCERESRSFSRSLHIHGANLYTQRRKPPTIIPGVRQEQPGAC